MHDEQPADLDVNALAVIAAYRREEQMPAALEERVWDRVEDNTAPATAARWGLVALVAAAVVAAVVVGAKSFTPEKIVPGTTPGMAPYEGLLLESGGVAHEAEGRNTHAPRRAAAEPGVALEAGPEIEPVLPAPVEVAPPEVPVAPDRHAKRPKAQAKTPLATPEITPEVNTLAEETRLLHEAQAAMKMGSPKTALALLASCEKKFPNGVLLEERGALRVIALCASGKMQAGRAAASVFLSKRPRSALAPRVRNACRKPE